MDQQKNEQTDMSSVRPTKKQFELLQYIDSFIVEHGYSPSYREIMRALDYNSVATVALHISSLIKRGHLLKRGRNARSLEVVRSSSTTPAVIKTNATSDSEEKWLVGRVEKYLADLEAQAYSSDQEVLNAQILLASLRILGLEGAAQSFQQRVQDLKSTVT